MPITLYNTLTRNKQPFEPRDAGKVTIYSCGLTPQGPAHLGHLRGAVVFDAIRRWFAYRGYQVRMVQNFTDIDDKIIRKAHEEGVSAAEIAQRYGKAYLHDWERLAITPVDFVSVTENMPSIVALTKQLVDNGHAYPTQEGDVYFSVSSFGEYGKLSRRDPADMEAGARVEVDPAKREPMDFALWKAGRPGEPSWDSPWGKGRPGWHIECSALSMQFLGETFDIHAGGIDLLFPHHENEIAQSEAATGKQFAKYWMHWGSVNSGGEKMSKSLGNFFTIDELLGKFSADILKLYVLSTHYRSPIDYMPERVAETGKSYERIRASLDVAVQVGGTSDAVVSAYFDRFGEAMDDDFNTAAAIGVVFEVVGELNKAVAAGDRDAIAPLANTVTRLFGVLGIQTPPSATKGAGADTETLAALVERAIAWRQEARKAKLYGLSDQIRDDLKTLGILLEDRPQGTTWRKSEI